MFLSSSPSRAWCTLAGALVVGGLAAPPASAQKKTKAKTASMVLPAPGAGDVSYAVIQVKRTSTRVPRPRGGSDRAVGQTVGGLGVEIRSSAWRRLRATSKVYVATSPVQGQRNPALRNVLVFVVRKRTKGRPGPKVASFDVRITNATAHRSFWVRSIAKSGRARAFTVRNALSTALGNWSGYLEVLGARNALRAAHRPVDATGRFRQTPPQATGRITTGGARMSARTRAMYELIFGTLGEPLSYQAAKKSPAVLDFIRAELGNAAMATRWADIAGRLPLQVPDAYAAAAKTEAQFTRIRSPKISTRQVVIRDQGNSTEQAAIEAPRPTNPKVPGTRVTVQITGSGSGTVTTSNGAISCPPVCTHIFTSGQSAFLQANEAPGSVLSSWDGCTGGVTGRGRTCEVGLVVDRPGPSRIAVAAFRPVLPPSSGPGPSGPGTDLGGLPPASLDPTFGSGGFASLPLGSSAFVNRIAPGPDGKLVLVGVREGTSIAENDWATARYTADGRLDSTGYSRDGSATLDESGVNLGGRDAVVAPDATTYVVGETTSGEVRIFGLTPAGTPNGGFGSAGFATVAIPGAGRVSGQAIAVQPDGKLVVVGDFDAGAGSTLFAARFLPGGAVDTTFDGGGDGVVTLAPSECDATGGGAGCTVTDMKLQLAGTSLSGIVVSGSTLGSPPGTSEGVVLRLAPTDGDGDVRLDTAYGDPSTPGRRVLEPARLATAGALVTEADGSVVVSGRTSPSGVPQCAIAKLDPAGDLDTAFGAGGSTTLTLADGCDAPGLARRPGGGYVLAGSDFASSTHAVLGRVSAAGQPDTTFAVGGVRTVPSAGEPGFFNDVVLQGDRIVAAGGALPYPHRFQIARYTGG